MSLIESIEASTSKDAMPWLSPADRGAVDLAKAYASAIDDLVATGQPDLIGKAMYLGPHLLGVLSSLGGTPSGRKALELKEEARGKLASIRDLRDRPAPTKKRARTA
jgi:hypothetical protein